MKYIRTKDGVYKATLVSPLGFVRIDKKDGTYPDVFEKDIIKQADTIEELCDTFEVTRYEGTSWFTLNTYTNFKKAYSDWYGCGYQGVTSNLYGLVNGKRVAILRGYTEGKHPDKIEMEFYKGE